VFDGIKGICMVAVEFHFEGVKQFKGQRVVIDGMALIVRVGHGAEYSEIRNGGVAYDQLRRLRRTE